MVVSLSGEARIRVVLSFLRMAQMATTIPGVQAKRMFFFTRCFVMEASRALHRQRPELLEKDETG